MSNEPRITLDYAPSDPARRRRRRVAVALGIVLVCAAVVAWSWDSVEPAATRRWNIFKVESRTLEYVGSASAVVSAEPMTEAMGLVIVRVVTILRAD